MKIRRVMTLAAAYAVALVVALAVPITQLRTVETVSERCCCPDPSNCHCPHQKAGSQTPQLRTCHRASHDILAPELPAFGAPEIAFVAPQVTVLSVPVIAHAEPHPAPAGRRPDAPS
ncbi:MAG TPA: hypothetical protein VGC41_08330 [Kofleriaceae bacterium]